MQCKTRPGADCGSDHQLLVFHIRTKLRSMPKSTMPVRFDLTAIPHEYSVEVSYRFTELSSKAINAAPDALLSEVEIVLMSSANKCIAQAHSKKRSQAWITPDTIKLIEQRRSLKAKGKLKSPEYRTLSKTIRRCLRADRQRQIDGICKDLEQAAEKHYSRDLLRTVKELSGKFTSKSTTLKSADGRVLSDHEMIKDRWRIYCKDLFASQEHNSHVGDLPFVEANEKEPEIIRDEIVSAIAAGPTGKAVGADEIPAELLRSLPDEGIDLILTL